MPTVRMGRIEVPPPSRGRAIALSLVAGCVLATGPVWAQSVRLNPAATVRVTATNNAGLGPKDQAKSDVIFDVAPTLGISITGANYSLEGSVGLEAVAYAGNEQSSDLFPRARLALRSNPIERLFFLDASVDATTTSSDPFAARIDADAPFAQQAITQYATRVSPYIQANLQPKLRFVARSDNEWVQRRNGSRTTSLSDQDARFQRSVVRLAHDPVPMGFVVEATADETRYPDRPDAGLSLDAARIGVNYLLDAQLLVGLIAGRERSAFSFTDKSDPIRGMSLRWTPTERTTVSMLGERRFFGNGWDVAFSHRSPFLAISGALRRQPVIDASSLGISPAGSDLAALLDSIFTTRIPNEADRARAVQDYLLRNNLPSKLPEAVEVFAGGARLNESGSVTLALMGTRQLVSFTLFGQRDTNLNRVDQPILVVSADEVRQYGGSALYSRQLTSQRSIEAALTGVATDGLGLRAGDYTRDWSLHLSVTEALTPRTNVVFGFRRQLILSNAVPPTQETRVFSGVAHRF